MAMLRSALARVCRRSSGSSAAASAGGRGPEIHEALRPAAARAPALPSLLRSAPRAPALPSLRHAAPRSPSIPGPTAHFRIIEGWRHLSTESKKSVDQKNTLLMKNLLNKGFEWSRTTMTTISKNSPPAILVFMSVISVTSVLFTFKNLRRLHLNVFGPGEDRIGSVSYEGWGAYRDGKTVFGHTEARVGPINYVEGRDGDGKIVKRA